MENNDEKKYFDFNQRPGKKMEKTYIKEKINPLIEIITTFSEYKNIEETFNSLINQTFIYWNWNIIDVDKKINSSIIEKDSRVKIYNEKNIEDKIVNESSCEFIFILKDGDTLDATALECLYWSLMTNSDACWAYTNYVVDEKTLKNTNFTSEYEKNENIVSSSYMIRKKEYVNIKITERIDSDWQLFLKLLEQEKFPVKLNFYGNWTKSHKENKIETAINNETKLEKNIDGINYPVGSSYWFDTAPFEFKWDLDNKLNHNKTNLLFIFPWFRIGGADKFNYELISNLDKNKYNITIITTEPCEYIWRQKFEQYAEIFDITSFLHRKYWAAFIHYVIKTRNIDLIMNSNSYYGYYVLPWLKSKFPNIIITDYLHAINWNWRNGEYPTDSTAISRIIDETFVSSNNLKETMESELGRKKDNTKVIYIGVDEERFNENNPEIKLTDELIANQNKYKNKKVILFCSRISKEKRPILMLKIFEKIKKQRNDVILFVVGDGEELQFMKDKAEQLNLKNDIIFFGMQEDVRIFYKISDVLTICSIREGLTLTTYEALAMSTPVVTANIGGQSELVDNTTGRLVKNIQDINQGESSTEYSEEEIENYAQAIIEVLYSKEYEKIKENCRKKIVNKFTIKKMVEDITNEYESLINNGTQIPKDIINNEELYKQYLILYNETDRRFYNNPKGGVMQKVNEENEYDKLKREIREKEIQVEEKNLEIEQKKQEFNKIYSSRRWKYMSKILKIFKR